MSNSTPDPLAAFVERIVEQLAKNGFPARQVSFPIERMYEAAAAKALSFNKVLEVLAERGIAHEKTPEKVIFSPVAPAASSLDPSAFAGLDPTTLAGLSQEQMLAAAQIAPAGHGTVAEEVRSTSVVLTADPARTPPAHDVFKPERRHATTVRRSPDT